MTATHETPHFTDADVVRHVDAETDATERARFREHLEGCAACAARVDAFRARRETVSAWLARADHELPAATTSDLAAWRARRSRAAAFTRSAAAPWLRAAVIVLLLAAPLAALQPVREWVAERVGLAEPAPTAAPAVLMTAESPADQSVVRFTPAADVFTVRAAPHPAGSVLTLGRSEGEEAVLRTSAGGVPPVVSDDAVRLAAPEIAAGYALRVPGFVKEVRVIVGGRVVAVPASGLDAGRTVELSRGS